MKKPLKITGVVLISILAVTALAIRGYKVMKQIEHNEMVKIVKSEEVKTLIEKRLKFLDSNALSEQGVIKKYEIDNNSIQHNPMGGIMFTVFVNDDKELGVTYIINKNNDGSYYSSGSYSSKLDKLLKKKNNE